MENIFDSLLLPLILTVLIESFVAFLTGVRRKQWLLCVVLVNMLTNPALNAGAFYVRTFFQPSFVLEWLLIIAAEALVVIVEWRIYRKLVPCSFPFLLSLLLNACSFGFGLILSLVASLLQA